MSSSLTIVREFYPKVEKVRDAKQPLIIEVTKADAASRAAKSHVACALAVACKRRFHMEGVVISRSTAYLVKRNLALRFLLPNTLRSEIVAFDRGAQFSPGIYHLSAVPESRRLGRRQGTDTTKGQHGKGPSRFRHITNDIRDVLAGREG